MSPMRLRDATAEEHKYGRDCACLPSCPVVVPPICRIASTNFNALIRTSILHKFTAQPSSPQPSPNSSPRKRKRDTVTPMRHLEAGSSKGSNMTQRKSNSRKSPFFTDGLSSEVEEEEPSTPKKPTSSGACSMYLSLSNTNAPNPANNPLVECPMCSQYVPMSDINRHMDSGCAPVTPRKNGGRDAWKGLLDGKGKDKDAVKPK
jgi:hypothetical protein